MHVTTPLLAAFLAWTLGQVLAQVRGHTWLSGVGVALVLWPPARVVARIALDLRRTVEVLFTPTELRPLPLEAMLDILGNSLQRHLLAPLLGMAILFTTGYLQRIPKSGADRAAWGLVPLALVLELGAFLLAAGPARVLNTGDTFSLFQAAPWWVAILLAWVPAISEEIAYRGALLPVLARGIGTRWAIGLQAVLFGLAHAGFGDIQRLLAPTALGLGNGLIAHRWGLLPAILVHGSLNLAFVAVTPTADRAIVVVVAVAAGLAGLPFVRETWRRLGIELRRLVRAA